jgi:hypothetical protein
MSEEGWNGFARRAAQAATRVSRVRLKTPNLRGAHIPLSVVLAVSIEQTEVKPLVVVPKKLAETKPLILIEDVHFHKRSIHF